MLGFTQRLETWKQAFLNPKEAFKGLATTKLGIKDGIENIGSAMIISFLITSILALIFTGMFGVMAIAGLFFGLAIYVIVAVIVSLIYGAAMLLMAKILGSKVEFGKLFYAYSIPTSAITMATLVISVVSIVVAFIPMLGVLEIILSIIQLLVGLYGIYLLTLAIKAVTKLPILKSVAVWLVPTIVIFLFLALVFGSMVLLMLGPLLSMAP